MHVIKKNIKGKEYYYLKISERKGDTVRTKNVAYLGKAPMTKQEIENKIKKIPRSKIALAKKELHECFEDINEQFLTQSQVHKLNELKKDFLKKLKLDKDLIEDMFTDFKTLYIYNTNAIEGNSLTLQETNLLLNKNQSPEGKDLREIYDHINAKETFDHILKDKPAITKSTIIDIHARLLQNIDKRVGSFRKHNVRVFGATFQTSDARYVEADMKLLLEWHKKYKKQLHPIVLAAAFHEKFERIHPFYDGNGRTGRMILNLMLLENNVPPLIMRRKNRKRYYDVLDKGHKASITGTEKESYKPIVTFCYDRLIETYEEIFSKWG